MNDADRWFYLGVGPLAAIALGIALIPLREITTASNLTFFFLVLIIAVAELGGRWAAVATALTSALSLNFFLTKPYLRLTIENKNDIIAFIGLAICGLIAAALGSYRSERIAALSADRRNLDLVHAILSTWDREAPTASQLPELLRSVRETFPIAAAVIRDEQNRVLAVADRADRPRPAPEGLLESDTVLSSASFAARGGQAPALPESGVRIPLVLGTRRLGWLDVWGNGRPASAETRRALADVGRLLTIALAGRRT
jgi:K+-sensing histidine kinase KdpD